MTGHKIPALAVAALLAGASGAALGHAYVHMTHMPAGWIHDIEVRVPHGCGPLPTNEVRVKIPEGVTRVRAEHSSEWKIDTVMRKLDPPMVMEGGFEVTETVGEIVWSGSELPPARFGRFVFRAALPDEPGRILWFKTTQRCGDEELRWDKELTDESMSMGAFLRTVPDSSPFVVLTEPERPQYDF